MKGLITNFWVVDSNTWMNAAFLNPKRWREYHRELLKRIDNYNIRKEQSEKTKY